MTELWQFENCCQIYENEKSWSYKGWKGENHIISRGKKLHNSTKSWLFFKKLGSFELLMVWAARNCPYLLNLTHSRPFYEQITLCASYYIRICINIPQVTENFTPLTIKEVDWAKLKFTQSLVSLNTEVEYKNPG